MLLMILDAKTSTAGAAEGVQLCIKSVIPSLFPFLILSKTITAAVIGHRMGFLSPLGKLCAIPAGCESLLLVGLIGGYPIGAKSVYDSYRNKFLDTNEARRLLSFCSNAGPAFIFGMSAQLFKSAWIPWVIWCIHIISAIIVGIILPRDKADSFTGKSNIPQQQTSTISQSVAAMGMICGWVVIFRVIIAILNKWFLRFLPGSFTCIFAGFLELSNGCTALSAMLSEQQRFVAICCFLAFGGLCVLMQTVSVVGELGVASYIKGKLLQTLISFILASAISPLLFPGVYLSITSIIVITITLLIAVGIMLKNNSSNTRKIVV